VILIDEYDKPLIDNLSKKEIFIELREFLKAFYSVFKEMDQYLKFVFLTGVSKFSKVGVFSGLNQLQDISMDSNFADLLGWTQEELEKNFDIYIEDLAKKEELTKNETIEKIKFWYNGYRFSKKFIKVYNPFSTLLLFKQQDFVFHWYDTGTPTFLVDLVKKNQYDLQNLDFISELDFSSYEIENLQPLPLLFQTGYLTIKSYDKENMLYSLDYPNFEVKQAFVKRLTESMAFNDQKNSTEYIFKLTEFLKKNEIEEFFEMLKIFFSNIPYDIQVRNEKYYQTIFYLIFTLIGLKIEVEAKTNIGRMDAIVQYQKNIFIFEFKLNGTKEDALKQIKEKKYYEKFLGKNFQIKLIGVEFDKEEKNIGEWVVEELK